MSKTLRSDVFDAMDNAEFNRYPQFELSSDEVVQDLLMYDADLENEKPETLRPLVVEWQRRKRKAIFQEHTHFWPVAIKKIYTTISQWWERRRQAWRPLIK